MPLSGYKCQTLHSGQSNNQKMHKKHSFLTLFLCILCFKKNIQKVWVSLVTCLRNVLFSCKQNDIIVFHCYLWTGIKAQQVWGDLRVLTWHQAVVCYKTRGSRLTCDYLLSVNVLWQFSNCWRLPGGGAALLAAHSAHEEVLGINRRRGRENWQWELATKRVFYWYSVKCLFEHLRFTHSTIPVLLNQLVFS